jgi:hypothetical protein
MRFSITVLEETGTSHTDVAVVDLRSASPLICWAVVC